jgi:hypothetical protein
MEREFTPEPVLGRYVQHSGDLTQDKFVPMPIFVAFHDYDPIGLVNREIYPSELFRTLSAKLDHGLPVRRVAGGSEKFEKSFFFSLPSLVGPL